MGNHKIALSIIVIVIILTSLSPYLSYSDQVFKYTNISSDEYSAAQWILENTAQDDYILTDPSTGCLIRGIANRNASNMFIIDGHTPSTINPNLKKSIFNFFKEQDLSKLSSHYELLAFNVSYVVVSTRTAGWVNNGQIDALFPAPYGDFIGNFSGIQKFTSPFFTIVKSWDTVKIYKPVPIFCQFSMAE